MLGVKSDSPTDLWVVFGWRARASYRLHASRACGREGSGRAGSSTARRWLSVAFCSSEPGSRRFRRLGGSAAHAGSCERIGGSFQFDGPPAQAAAGAGGGGPWRLPPGFIEGTFGGHKLGEPLDPNNPVRRGAGAVRRRRQRCGTTITGVAARFPVRSHPDFEDYCCGSLAGLAADSIGSDKKPVYGPPAGPSFRPAQRVRPVVSHRVRSQSGVFDPDQFRAERRPLHLSQRSFFPAGRRGLRQRGRAAQLSLHDRAPHALPL